MARLTKEAKLKHKKEGFEGQKAIVLPQKVTANCASLKQISNAYITDIGYYPKAKFHYRNRPRSIMQCIIIYCTDGEGWVMFDDIECIVKKNQFIVIPANTPHSYGANEQKPWTIYWLHVTGEMVETFADTLSFDRTIFCHNVSFSEERIALFDSMYNALERGYSIDNLTYVNMNLWYFLSTLRFPDSFVVPINTEDKDLVDRAIDFMKQNLHLPLSLKEMAKHVNISQPHFSALFKKKTGYPPGEYFNHIKIQKACQHLRFTHTQVKEISYKLGFEDPYYFSRLFHNIMGVSPAAYRSEKKRPDDENDA
jgi:AraC-like DNA-binding protein/quercetin dioxygenase-like cupin family protein